MVDVGYGPKPTNQILVAGYPLVQILKVEVATNVYPGRLVKKGTGDDDIIVNTAAGACIGWAGYERTIKKHRPATVDTIYAAGAQIAVLAGGNFVIVASLASGQSVAKGARLVAGANGELIAATALTVTVPAGTTTVTSTAAQPDLVEAGGLPPQGIVVAIAEETVDASAAAKDIMVRSLI